MFAIKKGADYADFTGAAGRFGSQCAPTATAALPLAALEASFKGKGPWVKGLPRILETLEALGRARREGGAWRS